MHLSYAIVIVKLKFYAAANMTRPRAGESGIARVHQLAIKGRLREIDPDLLHDDIWRIKNRHGKTPIHFAATFGHLDQIAKRILVSDVMLQPDKRGITPIGLAIQSGHFAQIPGEAFTADVLLSPVGPKWRNLIHCLAVHHKLLSIPIHADVVSQCVRIKDTVEVLVTDLGRENPVSIDITRWLVSVMKKRLAPTLSACSTRSDV